eukprot:2347278-Prymnesium_polylepis.1
MQPLRNGGTSTSRSGSSRGPALMPMWYARMICRAMATMLERMTPPVPDGPAQLVNGTAAPVRTWRRYRKPSRKSTSSDAAMGPPMTVASRTHLDGNTMSHRKA